MQLILFDIDGTLLLTGGAGRIAFEKVFLELFGVENAWGDLVPDGKTDPAIIEEIAGRVLGRSIQPSEYDTICRNYLQHFHRELALCERFRVLPGVTQLLPQLQGRCALGVATGNFQEAAWAKLQTGKLRDYFAFGGFGCDSVNRTELTRRAIERAVETTGREFQPEKILLVGDTPLDVRVGKELGVKTLAVATGRTNTEEFRNYAPDFILEDLSDAQAFLKIANL